jgi:hypothetical protein
LVLVELVEEVILVKIILTPQVVVIQYFPQLLLLGVVMVVDKTTPLHLVVLAAVVLVVVMYHCKLVLLARLDKDLLGGLDFHTTKVVVAVVRERRVLQSMVAMV